MSIEFYYFVLTVSVKPACYNPIRICHSAPVSGTGQARSGFHFSRHSGGGRNPGKGKYYLTPLEMPSLYTSSS
jgi:hypothetical protein